MPASLTLPAVDDAQTISLSKGPPGPVPTELLMIHLRRFCFSSVARRSFEMPLSFPRSQVRSRAAYVCKCMICSFLAAAPAAPMLPGQPGFASGFSSWEKPHARAVLRSEPTSRSHAPAASSLEFLPLLFWGFPPSRWRLYSPQRRGYTRPVRPPRLGPLEGSARIRQLCSIACDGAGALYALFQPSWARARREKGFPRPVLSTTYGESIAAQPRPAAALNLTWRRWGIETALTRSRAVSHGPTSDHRPL